MAESDIFETFGETPFNKQFVGTFARRHCHLISMVSMKNKKRNAAKRETSIEYSYTVFLEPAAEGGYVVTCPDLPGLVTEGDSLAEARTMARDAICAYLESLRKDGEPIPVTEVRPQ